MTLEEIEARWKAATPGPWEAHSAHLIAHNDPWAVISFETNEDYLASLYAPTDVAWLIAELNKYKRAHAWFVQHTESGDGFCHSCSVIPEAGDPHDEGCEWVKAKELKL